MDTLRIKHCFCLAFSLVCWLSSCNLSRPGQLDWLLEKKFWDAKIKLYDINEDQYFDLVLSGYQSVKRQEKDGQPISDSVIALDGKTKEVIWSFHTKDHISSYPAIYKNRVYFGSSDGAIYALNVKNGNLDWLYRTQGEVHGTPTAGYGKIFIGSRDKKLYAINANTGAPEWTFSTREPIDGSGALSNRKLFIGGFDRHFYALNVDDGSIVWKFRAGGYFDRSAPTIKGSSVFVGNWDRNIYALHTETGKLKWAFPTKGYIEESSPVVYKDRIYVGSNDNHLYAIDRKTGQPYWPKPFSAKDAIYSTPAVTDQAIFFGSRDGSVYSLSHKGKIRWRMDTGFKIRSSPALANDHVYIGTQGFNLLAIHDPKMGTIHWGMFGGTETNRQSSYQAKKLGLKLTESGKWWIPWQKWLNETF